MFIGKMDIRRLDLNLLLVLDALFETGRVSAVARNLRVSQPSVSFALAKLRGFFNDELFVRTGSGMRPTPYALRLRDPIRDAIELINREILFEPTFDPALSDRCFVVCTSDIGELVFLPPLLRAFRARAPRASLRCIAVPHEMMEDVLERGHIDVALGYFPDLRSAALRSEDLFSHPFTCLVRRDHPTIRDEITRDQFLAADHLVVSQPGRSQEIFELVVAEMGLRRRILLHLPHFLSVPYFIATTDMIAIVPHAVGKAFAEWHDLRSLPPPVEIPTIPLKQHWHRLTLNDRALLWFRTLISETFKDRDPSLI